MKTLLCSLLFAAWTTMAFAQLPPMALHYKFNQFGIVNDYSGNGNQGTVFGTNLRWDHNQTPDEAFTFNGLNQRIDVSVINNFQEPLPLSISTWVYIRDSDFNPIFRNDVPTNITNGVWLYINQDRQVQTGFGDNDQVFPTIDHRSKTGTTTLDLFTWYHIAVVIRGPEDMDIYLNGQNDCGTYSGTGGPLRYSDAVFKRGVIGHDYTPLYLVPFSNPEYFDGYIAELSLFNGALSNNDVLMLYGRGGNASACCDINADFSFTLGTNGSVSFQSTSSGTISNLSWDFGDKSQAVSVPNSVSTVSHTYAQSGQYKVCLTASNPSTNCSDTYCFKITVPKSNRFAEHSTPSWSLYPQPCNG